METLSEINKKWHKKNKCELKKSATQPVFGDGPQNAQIVFIGEAPGKKEDLSGKPFIGSAGKFLAEMLEEVKLRREDVYITNVVKYRPPNNRDPKPEEIAECLPWLAEELNFIEPKIIVTLGRHALNRFFPEEKISEAHGKVLKRNVKGFNTENFFVLYHPAAALYNGSMRKTLIEDFKKLPKILKKLK
ncbi:MAG: uracil-DNA glycosylase [Patescibacteria group bacterium]|nr:uracil-DNA glycosylase [Patescibacteria group bacterium]